MKGDMKKSFGLDEDELIAVVFAFLITLVVALFLLRGCRPNQEQTTLPDGQNGNIPTVDVPIIPDDFHGGSVVWKGRGEPNSDIDLYLNEGRVTTARVDGTGSWSYDAGELKAGSYQLQARAKGADGNGLASQLYPFAILPALAMESLSADAGMVDARYGNGQVKLFGKSDPYAKLDLWLNGKKIGTTSADAIGNWRFAAPVAENGQYQLQVAKEGAAATAGNEYRFRVAEETLPKATEIAQLTAVVTPTIAPTTTPSPTALPATAVPNISPSINGDFQGTTIPLGDVLIDGKGQPDSVIELLLNNVVVGTAAVGADGNWQYGWALGPGNYTLQARSIDDSALISELIQFTVVDLNAPSIQALPIDIGAETVKLTGKGQPNTTLTILQDGLPVGTVVTGADGAWSLDVPLDRTEDQRLYRFLATTTDQNGTLIESNPIEVRVFPKGAEPTEFPVVTAEPTELNFDVEVIGVENGTVTDGEVSFVGRTTPNTPIQLILDDGTVVDLVTDGNGAWSYTLSDLKSGSYGVVIRPILPDGSGEALQFSTGFVVAEATPEATAPAVIPTVVPTVEATIEPTDVPAVEPTAEPTAVLTSTEFTFDSAELGGLQFGNESNVALGQLVLQGRGTPGARVELYENTVFFDATAVKQDGTWYLATNYNRPIGEYYFTGLMFINRKWIASSDEKILKVPEYGLLKLTFDGSTSAENGSVISESLNLSELPTTELILDASWSMIQPLEDQTGTRVGIARLVMKDIVANIIPEGSQVALRTFGNIEGNYSCRTDLLQPVVPLDPETMIQIIENISPKIDSNTPIAASLQKVSEDLAGVTGKKIVVLLTDGQETCDGDPALAIQQLAEQGIDVQVNIVGLSIAEDELKEEFKRWAELGGGEYYDTNNRNDLQSALSTLFGVSYQVLNSEGKIVAAGVANDQPLALKPGDYRIQLSGDSTKTVDVTIKSAETTEIPVK